MDKVEGDVHHIVVYVPFSTICTAKNTKKREFKPFEK